MIMPKWLDVVLTVLVVGMPFAACLWVWCRDDSKF